MNCLKMFERKRELTNLVVFVAYFIQIFPLGLSVPTKSVNVSSVQNIPDYAVGVE
jgi:hypothetical protein